MPHPKVGACALILHTALRWCTLPYYGAQQCGTQLRITRSFLALRRRFLKKHILYGGAWRNSVSCFQASKCSQIGRIRAKDLKLSKYCMHCHSTVLCFWPIYINYNYNSMMAPLAYIQYKYKYQLLKLISSQELNFNKCYVKGGEYSCYSAAILIQCPFLGFDFIICAQTNFI